MLSNSVGTLLLVLYLFQLICRFSNAGTSYVDQSYTNPDSNGGQDTPYKTLIEAFADLLNESAQTDVTIVVDGDASSEYELDTQSIRPYSGDVIVIRGSSTNSGSPSTNSMVCDALPTIKLSATSWLHHESSPPDVTTVASTIRFEGVRLLLEGDSHTDQVLRITNVRNIEFVTVCIISTMTVPDGIVSVPSQIQLKADETVVFQDVHISPTLPFAIEVSNTPHTALADLSLQPVSIQDPFTLPIFKMTNVDSVDVSRVTIDCLHDVDTARVALFKFLEVDDTSIFELDTLKISSCRFATINTFVTLTRVPQVDLTNIVIQDSDWEFSTPTTTSLFNVLNSDNLALTWTTRSLVLSNFTINNSNFSVSMHAAHTLFEFSLDKWEPTVSISDIQIRSTLFYMLRCSVFQFSLGASQLTEFSIQDVLITSSVFQMQAIFNYGLPSTDFYPTSLQLPWKYITDLEISNSHVIAGSIVFLEKVDDSVIPGPFEWDFFKFESIRMINNTFDTEAALITQHGAFTYLKSIEVRHNKFNTCYPIQNNINAGNTVVEDSVFDSNDLKDASIMFYAQMFSSVTNIYTQSMYFFRLFPQFIITARGIYLINVTMSNQFLDSYSNFLYINYAYVYLKDCTFSSSLGNRFQPFITVEYYAALAPSMAGFVSYLPDTMSAEVLYHGFPAIQALWRMQTASFASMPSDTVFFVVIEGCTFKDNIIDRAPILRMGEVFTHLHGFSLYNCSFINIDQRAAGSELIRTERRSTAHIINNRFYNIQGEGPIIIIDALKYEKEFIMRGNVFADLVNKSAIFTRTDNLNKVIIEENTVENSVHTTTVFDIDLRELTQEFRFTRNHFRQTKLQTSAQEIQQFNLLKLRLVRTTPDMTLKFAKCSFVGIEMNKTNQLITRMFDNSLFFFSTGFASVAFEDITIKDVKIFKEDSLFSLSSKKFELKNSVISDVLTEDSQGMSNIICDEFVLENLRISNIFGSPDVQGSAFTVKSSADEVLLRASLNNIVFTNIRSYEGSVMLFEGVKIAFEAQKLQLIDTVVKSKAAFVFESCTFEELLIDDTHIYVSGSAIQGYEQNIFYIGHSGTTPTANQSGITGVRNVMIEVANRFPGTFTQLSMSPELGLALQNVTIKAPMSTSSVQRRLSSEPMTHVIQYGVISMYGGYAAISNLTMSSFDVFKKSIITIGCDSAGDSNYLLLTESKFEDIHFRSSKQQNTQEKAGHIIQVSPDDPNTCSSSINIKQSAFERVSTELEGAILKNNAVQPSGSGRVDRQQIALNDSTFNGLTALKGSVIVDNSNQQYQASISVSNCSFKNNIAEDRGGAFWISKATVKLDNQSAYQDNYAGISGDLAYFEYPDQLRSSNIIQSPNLAKVVSTGPDYLQVKLLSNNISTQGGLMLSTHPDGTYVFSQVTSHSFRTTSFRIELVTRNGPEDFAKVVDTSNERFISLEFVFTLPNGQSTTAVASDCSESVCNVHNLPINIPGQAGESGSVLIQYKSERYTQTVKGQIYFRECVPGETHSAELKTCQICPKEEYSLNPEQKCSSCPEGAECQGGAALIIQQEYWRENRYSDQIYKCDEKDGVCLGGTEGNKCLEGYEGPRCRRCDIGLEYYAGSSDAAECRQCNRSTNNRWTATLYFLGAYTYQIVMLVLTYRESLKMYKQYMVSNDITVTTPDAYIRILNTYTQVLSVVGSVSQEIGEYIQLGDSIGMPFKNIFFSINCLFLYENVPVDKIERLNVIIYLLSPLLKIVTIAIAIAVYTLVKTCYLRYKHKRAVARHPIFGAVYDPRTHLREKIFYGTAVALCVMILVEQPGIIATLASYLSCSELIPDSGLTFLNSNRNISCHSEDYYYFRRMVVYPGLILWGIAIPLSIFLILYQNARRDCLNLYKSKLMRFTLGSLFVEFKPSRYYWGLVIMVFKVIVYIVQSSVGLSVTSKTMTIAQIFGIYNLLLYFGKNPYNSKDLYKCEKYSMIAYFVTLFYSLYFLNVEGLSGLRLWSLLIIAVLNLFTLFTIIFRILQKYYIDWKDLLQDLTNKKTRARGYVFTTQGLLVRFLEGAIQSEGDKQMLETVLEAVNEREGKSRDRVKIKRLKRTRTKKLVDSHNASPNVSMLSHHKDSVLVCRDMEFSSFRIPLESP